MKKLDKNAIKRSVYKILPKNVRNRLLPYMLPQINLDLDQISFRTANTPNEYLAAFNLVYKVFVDRGFVQPSSAPFRLAPQHCNPDSRVFIGVAKETNIERLIYSVSLFPDSDKGLPMDDVFSPQLDELRGQGRFIVEAGHLAADPHYKTNTMNIPMLGNKILFHYAHDVLQADDIVITTHPKYKWIYEDLLLFTKIGEIDQYGYANNNPAIALRLDIRTIKDRYSEIYENKNYKNNLHDFFFLNKSKSITMPAKDPVETQLLESVKALHGIKLKSKESTIHFRPRIYPGHIKLKPISDAA